MDIKIMSKFYNKINNKKNIYNSVITNFNKII